MVNLYALISHKSTLSLTTRASTARKFLFKYPLAIEITECLYANNMCNPHICVHTLQLSARYVAQNF